MVVYDIEIGQLDDPRPQALGQRRRQAQQLGELLWRGIAGDVRVDQQHLAKALALRGAHLGEQQGRDLQQRPVSRQVVQPSGLDTDARAFWWRHDCFGVRACGGGGPDGLLVWLQGEQTCEGERGGDRAYI